MEPRDGLWVSSQCLPPAVQRPQVTLVCPCPQCCPCLHRPHPCPGVTEGWGCARWTRHGGGHGDMVPSHDGCPRGPTRSREMSHTEQHAPRMASLWTWDFCSLQSTAGSALLPTHISCPQMRQRCHQGSAPGSLQAPTPPSGGALTRTVGWLCLDGGTGTSLTEMVASGWPRQGGDIGLAPGLAAWRWDDLTEVAPGLTSPGGH